MYVSTFIKKINFQIIRQTLTFFLFLFFPFTIYYGIREIVFIEEKKVQPPQPTHPSDLFVAIGRRYWEFDKKGSNPTRAKKFFDAAAKQNNPTALVNLGLMKIQGIGGEKNINEGISLINLATKQENNGEALYFLGLCYLYGYGVDKCSEKAVDLLKASANKKYAYASNVLNKLFIPRSLDETQDNA